MRSYTLRPATCSEQTDEKTGVTTPPTMTGSVKLKIPSYTERQKLRLSAYDVIDAEAGTEARMGLTKMPQLVEASKEFYEAVDLKILDDGTEIKTLDDMMYDVRCDAVLQEVAILLVKGMSPSKN